MMKVYCFECGRDCSNCYGTFKGYPYHFMCIPAPPKKRRPLVDLNLRADTIAGTHASVDKDIKP